MRQEHLALLACPDCRGPVGAIPSTADAQGLHCPACKLLFPIEDGIPILLPASARNPALESPGIQRLQHWIDDSTRAAFENTQAVLAKREGATSWEWEDEEFWGEEYRRLIDEPGGARFGMRMWQREFLIDQLLERGSLQNKVMVDVGCGAGNNFRNLFRKHCDASTTYIGADIAIDGLRLNRKRNTPENGLYVTCSANRLPFRPGSVDLITYFGVLHHTERKSLTIPEDYELLGRDGYMIVHEALDRPSAFPGFLRREVVESAHEERVDPVELEQSIASIPSIEIVARREMHTVFFGGLRKLLRRFAGQRRAVYEAVVAIDRGLMRALRGVSGFFKPGEVMLLLHRPKRASSDASGDFLTTQATSSPSPARPPSPS